MAIAVYTSLVQLFDNSGDPLNGGSVTVYQAGTTTPISLFSDESLGGGFAVANPIVLDSAGRHAMTFFSQQSYKVLIKNSAGSTLVTRDHIDPGLPIGTGDLAVADGGTGASTAAGARTNLSAASAADLADLAADVADLAGTLASSEKTHLATGTTAQRPATPIEGDVRRNTSLATYEGYDGAAWVNFVVQPTAATDPSATATQEGLVELATQAEMVTATDAVRVPTPATVKYNPGVAKCSGTFAGATGTLASGSVNVTSVVRDTQGDYTVTIGTDFADAEYQVQLTVLDAAGFRVARVRTQAAGVFTIKAVDAANSDQDPDKIYFTCFGTLV